MQILVQITAISYLPDRTSYSGESDRTGYQQRSLGESQNAYSRPWTERKDRNQTSDGLEKVLPGEVDTMIAAGMGGGLVIKILMEGRTVADALDTMILQPQSEIGKVRRFLNEHRLQIIEENMVEEDGKFYPMMKVIHGEKEEYTVCEYTYGKMSAEAAASGTQEISGQGDAIKEHVFGQLFKHQNSEVLPEEWKN